MVYLSKIVFPVFFLLSALVLSGQSNNTIGTISVSDNVADGYTLFAPGSSNITYLIDNCGNQINSWESDRTPGLSAYLLPNGNLVRTRRESQSFGFYAGGVGGGIEIFDWDGNKIWDFTLANPQNILHHDIAPMPNGNILAIAYELVTKEEVLALGRDLDKTPEGGLWIDKIIEIKPLDNNDLEIVWEWSSIDHIIQDSNASLPNFGSASGNPGKLDFNYVPLQNSGSDWMHSNAIDYNPELDQVCLLYTSPSPRDRG